MKKRLKKKINKLIQQDKQLFGQLYPDTWDYNNAEAELSYYLNQQPKTRSKIKLLRHAINFEQQILQKDNY